MSAFKIGRVERSGGDLRHPAPPYISASFRDWTAREWIAVEAMKALLALGSCREAAVPYQAFKIADAMVEYANRGEPKPLDPALSDATRLVVAPDGVLEIVPGRDDRAGPLRWTGEKLTPFACRGDRGDDRGAVGSDEPLLAGSSAGGAAEAVTTIPVNLILTDSGGARIELAAAEGVRALVLTSGQAVAVREWALWPPTGAAYDGDGCGDVEGSALPEGDEE